MIYHASEIFEAQFKKGNHMKKILLSLAVLGFAQSALAAPKCYRALNPQNITISSHEDTKTERAVSARIKLETEKTIAPEGYEILPNIDFQARSKSMRFTTGAGGYDQENPNTYYVDCDGGNVSVQVVGGIVVLNSERLSGEVKTSNGCSTGSVTFSNLAFEEVTCK